MRIFGVSWEKVREAGRLEDLHAQLRAERDGEEAAGGEKKRNTGCLVVGALFIGPWIFVYMAAPALLAGLSAAVPWVPEPPRYLPPLLVGGFLLCAALSVPIVGAGGVGKLNPFLALRAPSREALLLSRLSGLASRTLLGCLGWGAAVAIRLMSCDAPPSAVLSLAAAVALLPAAVVVRVAQGKAVEGGTRRARAGAEIGRFLLGLVMTAPGPWFLPWVFREVASDGWWRMFSGVLWLFFGPLALWTGGSEVLGWLRRGGIPTGAWTTALVQGGTTLILAAAVVGAGIVGAVPGEVVGMLGAGAPAVGVGVALLLAGTTLLLLRSALREFAEREVLLEGAEENGVPAVKPPSAVAAGPFPPPEHTLAGARMRNRMESLSWWELLLGLTLLGVVVGAALRVLEPFYLLPTVMVLVPWDSLKHRERAWLLGMELRAQRRHERWMGVVWQGPLVLGLSAGAIPLVGGGGERWAILPLLAGVLLLRTGIEGWEAVLRSRGFRSFSARVPLYVLLIAVVVAPFGGAVWSLRAAALAAVLGGIGLLLEGTLVTEEALKEEMLDAAEKG